jgi:hypothetical protein
MSEGGVTVSGVDTSAILYAAELEAPGLTETARRILEAEAAWFCLPLDVNEVLVRRAGGGPEVHVVAAGDLVTHLVATEEDPLSEDSPVIVLARAGALALMTWLELDESR